MFRHFKNAFTFSQHSFYDNLDGVFNFNCSERMDKNVCNGQLILQHNLGTTFINFVISEKDYFDMWPLLQTIQN